MRKVLGVLTAFVVSGSLMSVSLADQAADVARIEKELRAADEAAAVYDRARKRAKAAVAASSVGRKLQWVEDEWLKFLRREEIAEPASKLREWRIIYRDRVDRLIKRWTRIFLDEEIERAQKEKLDSLSRELKRIRRKSDAEI